MTRSKQYYKNCEYMDNRWPTLPNMVQIVLDSTLKSYMDAVVENIRINGYYPPDTPKPAKDDDK